MQLQRDVAKSTTLSPQCLLKLLLRCSKQSAAYCAAGVISAACGEGTVTKIQAPCSASQIPRTLVQLDDEFKVGKNRYWFNADGIQVFMQGKLQLINSEVICEPLFWNVSSRARVTCNLFTKNRCYHLTCRLRKTTQFQLAAHILSFDGQSSKSKIRGPKKCWGFLGNKNVYSSSIHGFRSIMYCTALPHQRKKSPEKYIPVLASTKSWFIFFQFGCAFCAHAKLLLRRTLHGVLRSMLQNLRAFLRRTAVPRCVTVGI